MASSVTEPDFARLLADIRGCRHCAAVLPCPPRPIVQASPGARLVIIGQAPGSRVQATGVSWGDASGDRLRQWLGIDGGSFYDPQQVALIPMGFCYPGKASGGDRPPRPECAPLWHPRLLPRIAARLTLLVGRYAQIAYLPAALRPSMTEAVRGSALLPADYMALPHPAWRSVLWMRQNPWFEAEILPQLRANVASALAR